MMTFRTVKTALKTILEAGATGKYYVVGGQRQSKGANEDLTVPRVTIYYQSGEFVKSGSSMFQDKKHLPEYRIEITVVSEGTVDLSVLNNEGSSAAEIKAALAAMPDLAEQADNRMDQAFDDIYQVLMAADKYDLDLDIGIVRDRWVNNFKKDKPIPRGQYIILSASCNFTCNVTETVTGITGTDGAEIDNTINIEGDPNDNAGTSADITGG
jgi:hypothetical protein